MSKEKETKKPKSKARKIISWILTGIFGALFVVMVVFNISANVSKKNNYGVPNFGGMQICIVLTDSMEPQYTVNSAIFVKKVSPSTLAVGDNITFYYEKWAAQFNIQPIVTHQISKIEVDETKQEGKGKYTFTCHGINKNSSNCKMTGEGEDCTKQTQVITDQYVLGKVVGNSKFVGGLYQFITSIWGLIIVLGVPVTYIIVTVIIDLVKALKENDEQEAVVVSNAKATNSNALANLSEEDKERLKKEMLEEMMRKGKK